MTAWSYVALAGIVCTTITVCWGLWLNSVYQASEWALHEDTGEYPVPTKPPPVEPSEQVTRKWPADFTGAEDAQYE